MNWVWTSIMLVGLGMLLVNNVDIAVSSILEGGSKAISLSLKLWGIYAVWLGILKIVEETGLDKKLSKLFRPLINKLIGKTDEYTSNQIVINITSNLLGMGNASTPSGINAIAGLDKGSKYATASMIMILMLNSTSLQLIPTTIVGLRISAGSVSASDIIIPTLISTLASTLVGILLVKICSKIFKDK
ncbi:MAG: spore maturation protein [Christensenellales bacterium]